MLDFFISYNSIDRPWAEWIAWQLEEQGLTTSLQAWDFRPGANFVLEMQKATLEANRIIAVLSPAYLAARFTQPEWAIAFAQDPTGDKNLLIPVRIRDCDLRGLLPQIIYIDLTGQDETAARESLYTGISRARAKPQIMPPFPGTRSQNGRQPPLFPGDLQSRPIPENNNASQKKEVFPSKTEVIHSEEEVKNDNDEKDVAVGVGTVEIEITINREFKEYSTSDQEKFLKAIGEFLMMEGNLKITKKRPGSVKITLSLSSDQAEKLLWAIKSGQFEEFGAVDAELKDQEESSIVKDVSSRIGLSQFYEEETATYPRGDIVGVHVDGVEWQDDAAEFQNFPHYMLKEIFEQPRTITNALRDRLIASEGIAHLGGLDKVVNRLKDAQHLVIVSCGTSYYAGLYGRYVFERLTDLVVEVEIASEMRYSKTNIRPGTVVLGISQSGETADTIAAMHEAGRKGALLLGLVNVEGSTISHLTEAGVYNHGGPEISISPTKIFTSQCSILVMIALMLGRFKHLSVTDGMEIVAGLEHLPMQINTVLKQVHLIRSIAAAYAQYDNFLFIGRKYNYPIALEGALKLKEISYIHAEGCAAGEMKYGFIAMIDKRLPTVCLATKDMMYDKVISDMHEIKSHGGKIIAIATEGDDKITEVADDVIYTPANLDFLQPIPAVVALQLFAYYCAVERGCEIDTPRNLAKVMVIE